MNGKFLLNRSDGKIMGVAAGFADWSGDRRSGRPPRPGRGLLLTGPVVVLFYVLTGWLASER